jgi:hypothetical protein
MDIRPFEGPLLEAPPISADVIRLMRIALGEIDEGVVTVTVDQEAELAKMREQRR